jgi:hypothetical protein
MPGIIHVITLPYSSTPYRKPLHLKHGHVAIIGGFACELDQDETPFFPHSIRRLTLSATGIRFVPNVHKTLIPNIGVEDIQDCSKASALTKTILCLQVFGFCTQILARWHQRLFISLPEITTTVQAVFPIAMCVLWWMKSKAMNTPFMLKCISSRPMAALLAVASFGTLHETLRERPRFKFERSQNDLYHRVPPRSLEQVTEISPGQIIFGFRFLGWQKGDTTTQNNITLSREEIDCFHLAKLTLD